LRNIFFNAVNFHGYVLSKKGNRSKIELLEKLKGAKGLSKRRKNILGGNFNFVENDRDRKLGGEEQIRKEKMIKETFLSYSGDFKLFVRMDMLCVRIILVLSRRHLLLRIRRNMMRLGSVRRNSGGERSLHISGLASIMMT
jgi:hypothetical protein